MLQKLNIFIFTRFYNCSAWFKRYMCFSFLIPGLGDTAVTWLRAWASTHAPVADTKLRSHVIRTFGAQKMLSKRVKLLVSVASKLIKTASEILGFAAKLFCLDQFRSSRILGNIFTMLPLTHSLTFKHLTNLTSKLLQNTGQNFNSLVDQSPPYVAIC